MEFSKLTVILPVYNEFDYIITTLDKIKNNKLKFNLEIEIIVINDFSNDGTEEQLKIFKEENRTFNMQYFNHKRNLGKGAAIRTGLKHATGEIILIQDADLEYDPIEYNKLLNPIITGVADVVYGSRFKGSGPQRALFFWHYLGNKVLTLLSNIFSNLNLTDMETCYKVFKNDIIKSLDLRENRFGFEPEVTAKISKIEKIRIYEVGIAYYGRDYSDGKKINWKDGISAIWCIFRYNLFD